MFGKLSNMSQAQSLVGEKLGSFRIESVVGSGAMGVVYRGTNEKTGRVAAVKVVSTEFAQGGKIRDRFEREAEILQQFRHPNIVRFLAVGRFRGTSYLAMEFVDGVTLEKIILERGGLPWLEVVDLGIQICDALHYAHQHGVVHRDLKPSNLMIGADGKVKLTDFGIAKDLDATQLTGTGRTLGTAAYMAPEQIRGTPPVSHKTDLYALGVVFYQLLVGKPPFEGSSPVVLMHSHLNEAAPRPSARIHEIPKVLDELVVNLMAKLPADRPWDAAAVGLKLTELREKVNSGAPIGMVFPKQGAGGKSARTGSKAGSAAGTDSLLAGDEPGTVGPRKKTRKARTLAGMTGRDRTEIGGRSSRFSRSVIETVLLVSVLIAIGGFIAYIVWPPSAPYLFAQAQKLMASTRPFDWTTAREEYMKELDERFPDHPYHAKLREWRDKILLEGAESRSGNLASGLDIALTRPVNDAERKFVVTNAVADKAKKRFDELAAMAQWQEMADQLKEAAKPKFPEDPVERQWYLLALRRVEQLQNAIKDRRESVLKQMAAADAAFRGGRPNEGVNIRAGLVEQYGKFTDLADIFQTPASANERTDKDAGGEAAPTAPRGESDRAASAKPGADGKDVKEKDAGKREPVPADGTASKDESPKAAPKSEPKENAPEF